MEDGQYDLFAGHALPDFEGVFDAQLGLPLPNVYAPAPISLVRKRDGREECFAKSKIADAIFRAAQSIGGQDRDLAESLASAVAIYLSKRMGGETPSVDHVHDAVERVLIHMAHAKTALAYARYRDRRARIRRLREGDLRILLGELEEARLEREALGGHPDGALLVRTSGDTITNWDRKRIESALVRETGLEEGMAALIALEVEQQIHHAKIGTLTTSLVRELVDAKLIEHGLNEYRARHRRLGVPLYDTAHIMRGATPETVGQSPALTDRVLAHAVKKEYALAEVFSGPVAEAHLRGDFHVHRLNQVDRLFHGTGGLEAIARGGIALPGSGTLAEAPKHADTMLAQMARCNDLLQDYYTDGVGWDAVNVYFAPYLHGAPEEVLGRFAEMLVYEFMYRSVAQGDAAAKAEIGLCWTVPDTLRDRNAIALGGVVLDKNYGAYEHTAQRIAWSILDTMIKGAESGMAFQSPQLRFAIGPNFFETAGHDRFLAHTARAAALRVPCHFRFHRALDAFDPDTVLHQITLNLPRAAYESGKESRMIKRIDALVHLAAEAHQEKRDFLDTILDTQGNGPLAHLARNAGTSFDTSRARCYIAVAGLNECVQALLNQPMHADDEAAALAGRILDRLAESCERESSARGLNIAASECADPGIGQRFATLDLQQFPQSARRVVKTTPAAPALHYTAGIHLPEGHGLSPIEAARFEGMLQARLAAGFASSIPLPEGLPAPEAVADFIKKAWRQTDTPGLNFV